MISCVLLWEAHDVTGPAKEYVERAGCIIRRERKDVRIGTGSVTAPYTTVALSGDELLWQALICVGVAARDRADCTAFLWEAEQVLRQWWEEQR